MAMAVWSAQVGKKKLGQHFFDRTLGLGSVFFGVKVDRIQAEVRPPSHSRPGLRYALPSRTSHGHG